MVKQLVLAKLLDRSLMFADDNKPAFKRKQPKNETKNPEPNPVIPASNENVTYYVIDRSRASPVVLRFFKRSFAGALVTDFLDACNAVWEPISHNSRKHPEKHVSPGKAG